MDAFFGQIGAALAGMSLKKKVSLLMIVGLTVGGLYYLVQWSGRPDYQMLYTNLSMEDAGSIVEQLKSQKVPYQVTAGGSCIEVPSEKIYELRMAMASEGLPQGSGVGFEVFDNAKLGMTEFMQNVNYQRALQGELARTINQIDEIESSRVHIVMPTQTLFVEEEIPASASVVLKIKSGRRLGQGQIQGIIHLVSSSISGLNTENVTVVDNRGKLLAGKEDASSPAAMSTDQYMHQRKMESTLENRIKTMLEEVLGPNKAIVRVACELDFMRHEQTEEMYLPDNQVVRSEQTHNETTSGSDNLAIGIPGVSSNTEPNGIGIDTDTRQIPDNRNTTLYRKQDQTKNFEIGKVVSRKVMPSGTMRRVSAAVVVDGNYELVSGKKGRAEWQYTPRSSEEMAQFEKIIKSAINFDAQRGDSVEIENIPFETAKLDKGDEAPPARSWMDTVRQFKFIFEYLILALFVILSFLFLVRPLVRWLTSDSAGSGQIIRQLPKTVSELENEYPSGAPRLSFRDQVQQMISSDNQSSVGVMRDWIKEQ
jgi:flagellar M-ring protein FliF